MERADGEPALAAVRVWRQELAGRAPYRVASGSEPETVPLKRTTIWSAFQSRQLEGIEAALGNVPLGRVFIDTGAQYTLLSAEAARAAGVVVGEGASEMVGFATFNALPGLVPELRIGNLVIRDVPVFVGDSPALARNRGQMAIGIDLLHHLRLTLDADAGVALVEPAAAAAPLGPFSAADGWQVRLWPLVQVCLAEARLDGQRHARVLIDTGNWEGTYVSARWARRNEVDLDRERYLNLVPLESAAGVLAGLELGDRGLVDHPVRGRLPAELERLDLLDVVVGHDVLEHQRVTIDLHRGLLRCERTLP